MDNLRMQSDIVLLEKIDQTPLSAIIQTDYGQDDKVWYGKVIAVGPGRKDKKGRRQPISVSVDDTVMVGSYTGEVHFPDELRELVGVRETDIMAVVE